MNLRSETPLPKPVGKLLRCASLVGAWLLITSASLRAGADGVDYTDAIRRLDDAVRAEMKAKDVRGIAIALIDDQKTVHAAGYGTARKDSIFRCGSISKLFNAVAVMQLVEAGKLDLDAPIDRYAPQCSIIVPFENAGPITLRQLLCHRSGMIRESPVGGYFDDSEPSLAETVASVQGCVLVNPPNTKTRYSNVGPSLAGQVVSTVAGMAYERYQQEHVLGPLGMTSSAYLLKGVPRARVLEAYMHVADGRGGFTRQKAPLFDLGTVPAGNLFTTVEDLARFVSMLAAKGRAGRCAILSEASLAQMFLPQSAEGDAGFGLGFALGKFGAHPTVRHMGAVYGYTSSLIFLPDAKVGVVLLSNEDVATGPVRKLSNLALSLMLEAKLGEKPPAPPVPVTLSPAELTKFAGDYESPSYWANIEASGNKLRATLSGYEVILTPVGPMKFLADGLQDDNTPVEFERDTGGKIVGFTKGQKFTRLGATSAPAIPDAWKPYLGSYGPWFIPLVITARQGHLYAMTENMADYRLAPVNRHVFAMPPGLYTDEHLVLLTDLRGRPRAVNLANMILRRR